MIGACGPLSLGEVSSVCVCLLTPPRTLWSGACVDRKFLTLTSFETAVTGPRRDLWLAALPALTRGRPRLAAWLRATVETTLAAVGLDEDN